MLIPLNDSIITSTIQLANKGQLRVAEIKVLNRCWELGHVLPAAESKDLPPRSPHPNSSRIPLACCRHPPVPLRHLRGGIRASTISTTVRFNSSMAAAKTHRSVFSWKRRAKVLIGLVRRAPRLYS